MASAVWAPLATLELEDILFYIRVVDGRPETSRRIGEELRDFVDQHANESRPGQTHPLAPNDWSYLKYKRWLVFYRPCPSGIEVMRVIDAVRDLPAQLRN
jgi:plasmid stabilization system protein ParE